MLNETGRELNIRLLNIRDCAGDDGQELWCALFQLFDERRMLIGEKRINLDQGKR